MSGCSNSEWFGKYNLKMTVVYCNNVECRLKQTFQLSPDFINSSIVIASYVQACKSHSTSYFLESHWIDDLICFVFSILPTRPQKDDQQDEAQYGLSLIDNKDEFFPL